MKNRTFEHISIPESGQNVNQLKYGIVYSGSQNEILSITNAIQHIGTALMPNSKIERVRSIPNGISCDWIEPNSFMFTPTGLLPMLQIPYKVKTNLGSEPNTPFKLIDPSNIKEGQNPTLYSFIFNDYKNIVDLLLAKTYGRYVPIDRKIVIKYNTEILNNKNKEKLVVELLTPDKNGVIPLFKMVANHFESLGLMEKKSN